MSDESKRPTKTERVMHIARLMAAGEYRTRLTEFDLCEKWGIERKLFRADAAEASRILAFDQKELEQLRVQQRAFLERVQQDSMTRMSLITGLPDYKGALEATKMTYEYVLGDGKREKERDPTDLSDEELRDLAKKATAMLLAPSAIGSESKDEQRAVSDPRPEG